MFNGLYPETFNSDQTILTALVFADSLFGASFRFIKKMSFRSEMVRRKLASIKNQAKESQKPVVFTATPLVKGLTKALSSGSSVPLLQKIKEGKDLEHLSSVMDIRLLKSVHQGDTPIEPAKNNHASTESAVDVASNTETPFGTHFASPSLSSENERKKLRLRCMQDLLEVLPLKSCEEFLYDCVPQLLTNSKDSSNYFQRRNERTGKFQFADVYSDYPAEKQTLESSLKSAAETGSCQSDIMSSIPLKTTQPPVSLIFDINVKSQSATLVIENLEQAAFALQPGLSRVLSHDPASLTNVASFEAIEQHKWWCAASSCSAAATEFERRHYIEDPPSDFENLKSDEILGLVQSEKEKLPSSEMLVENFLVVESTESTESHDSQFELKVGSGQKPPSPEELIQESVVADLYAEACKTLCTPVIDWLHKRPFLSVVNASHMYLRNNGVSSLAVIIMNSSKIELLDVSDNGISHVGMKHLCSSLLESTTIREVRLDCNPLGHKGAIQLSGALCCNRLNTSIEALSLLGCKLGDDGCAAIFKCLLSAVKMKSLNLSLNGAEIESAKAAADVLPLITGLQRLSLRWNAFKGSAAVVFCQGAMNNRSITDLDLSSNSFGDIDAVSHLGEAIKVMNHLKFLDVSYNKIDGRGAYILGSALETNHHVSNCNFSGNPIGMLGARILSQLVFATGVGQASKKSRKIQFENCNIQYVDHSLFDPNKTNGKYQLDLSDNYSRIVIENILRKRDLNQGEIIQGSIKINGIIFNKMTWKEDTIPQSGFLQFQFESFHRFPPKSEDCLSSKQLSSIKELLRPCSDENHRLAVFTMLIGNNDYFSVEQVKGILDMFQTSASRVALVLLLSFQIAPIEQKSLVEQILTPLELESQRIKEMNEFVRDFTILNPTGHYRLNLDCDDDQRLMDLLMKVRSDVKRRRHVRFSAQKHALITNNWNDLEWCILNAKWNGKDFQVAPGWMPPSQGVFDFDFTANVQPSKLPIEHDDFVIQMGHCNTDVERFKLLRKLSNSFSFRTVTVMIFLETLSSQQFMEDCIVALFDNIYEVPGFQYIISRIGPTSRENVIRSVGIHNCWCNGWIVDYHVLDLSNDGHRFVCQQLIALSLVESGECMVDVHYENKEFKIPVQWREVIPLEGVCSFFYCRENSTLDEYYSSFGPRALDRSVWRAFQPAGVDWVHARKRGNIKDRIKEKFPNPEVAFQTMDRDGGGSISRVELSTELRKLGIWLQVQGLF